MFAECADDPKHTKKTWRAHHQHKHFRKDHRWPSWLSAGGASPHFSWDLWGASRQLCPRRFFVFFLMFLIHRPGHYISKLRTAAAACWEGLSFRLSQPVCLKATVKYMLEFQHTCTSCSNKQVSGCLVLHFSKSGFWSPSRALLARHGTLHSPMTPAVPQAAPHPCTTQPWQKHSSHFISTSSLTLLPTVRNWAFVIPHRQWGEGTLLRNSSRAAEVTAALARAEVN